MYENRQEPVFDMPIPGMGMTHEVGARPWQQPAQYTEIDDVTQFYLAKIEDEAFNDNVLNLLETKMPVTMIANAMQTTGVMNGVHTIDVGMLTLPIIMEMIMFLADSEGIDYVSGTERDIDSEVMDTSIELAVDKVADDNDMMNEENTIEENEPMVENEMPTGLMARRV